MIAIDRYPRSARFAACLLVAILAVTPGCAKKHAAQGGFKMPPTPVETSIVTSAPMVDRFEAVGTIEAGEAITVVSEIDGAIVEPSLPRGRADPARAA